MFRRRQIRLSRAATIYRRRRLWRYPVERFERCLCDEIRVESSGETEILAAFNGDSFPQPTCRGIHRYRRGKRYRPEDRMAIRDASTRAFGSRATIHTAGCRRRQGFLRRADAGKRKQLVSRRRFSLLTQSSFHEAVDLGTARSRTLLVASGARSVAAVGIEVILQAVGAGMHDSHEPPEHRRGRDEPANSNTWTKRSSGSSASISCFRNSIATASQSMVAPFATRSNARTSCQRGAERFFRTDFTSFMATSAFQQPDRPPRSPLPHRSAG